MSTSWGARLIAAYDSGVKEKQDREEQERVAEERKLRMAALKEQMDRERNAQKLDDFSMRYNLKKGAPADRAAAMPSPGLSLPGTGVELPPGFLPGSMAGGEALPNAAMQVPGGGTATPQTGEQVDLASQIKQRALLQMQRDYAPPKGFQMGPLGVMNQDTGEMPERFEPPRPAAPAEQFVTTAEGVMRWDDATKTLVKVGNPEPKAGGMSDYQTAMLDERATVRADKAEAVALQRSNAANTVISKLERLRDAAKELREHKGLAGATGRWRYSQYNPFAIESAEFVTKKNALKSQIAQDALQAMRDASRTGGALGNASDKDIALLEKTLGSLDGEQREESLIATLDGVFKYAEGAIGRFQGVGQTQSGGGGVSVQTPDGQTIQFPSVEAADAFRKAHGL